MRWWAIAALVVALTACDGPEVPGEDRFAPTETADSTTKDAGADTSTEDTGEADSGATDTGATDTGAADTGIADTGTADTGNPDTGNADTGNPDTGNADTGNADTTPDAAAADAGDPCAQPCDDNNTCTKDSCDKVKGCQHDPLADATVCDLPNAATGVCHQKACIGVPAGMRYVPAATFAMGCVSGDTHCEADESPNHAVTLKAFFVDIHEVTNARYLACVNANQCTAPSKPCGTNGWSYSTWNEPGNAQLPVTCVTWQKASSFCANTANGRLPTEAEFERLLRSKGPNLVYPWGNAFPPPDFTGNYADSTANTTNGWARIQGYNDGYAGPAPVGSFKVDALGLHDVSGNVWEWTGDWYAANAYSLTTAAQGVGPTAGTNRVMRGGGFFWTNWSWRSSRRLSFQPGFENQDLGFRCVVDVK